MKLVKNNVVELDWNAEGFIESKKEGFISAVHLYGEVAVAFRDGKIYTHISEDGECIGFDSLVATIKSAFKEKDYDYPMYYEDYVEIFNGESFEDDILESLNLTECKADMDNRIADLEGYWFEEEVNL